MFSAACGLLVFAGMILRGLVVNNPVDVILLRALAGLFAALVLGRMAGWIAERVLNDELSVKSADDGGESPESLSTAAVNTR